MARFGRLRRRRFRRLRGAFRSFGSRFSRRRRRSGVRRRRRSSRGLLPRRIFGIQSGIVVIGVLLVVFWSKIKSMFRL